MFSSVVQHEYSTMYKPSLKGTGLTWRGLPRDDASKYRPTPCRFLEVFLFTLLMIFAPIRKINELELLTIRYNDVSQNQLYKSRSTDVMKLPPKHTHTHTPRNRHKFRSTWGQFMDTKID